MYFIVGTFDVSILALANIQTVALSKRQMPTFIYGSGYVCPVMTHLFHLG